MLDLVELKKVAQEDLQISRHEKKGLIFISLIIV